MLCVIGGIDCYESLRDNICNYMELGGRLNFGDRWLYKYIRIEGKNYKLM